MHLKPAAAGDSCARRSPGWHSPLPAHLVAAMYDGRTVTPPAAATQRSSLPRPLPVTVALTPVPAPACRYKKGYKNIINKGVELNQAGVPCPLMMETSGHGAMRVRAAPTSAGQAVAGTSQPRPTLLMPRGGRQRALKPVATCRHAHEGGPSSPTRPKAGA